ncbi:MAG: amidohydrolase family protein [Proteobacteria bacterium]|nr:amidohydrolase family protein [Pseudomonadota bacterium]
MTILIKGASLNGAIKDLYIEGNLIKEIEDSIDRSAEAMISGAGKAVIPSLINGHTHASMTLLRGYADDMHLQEWLEKKIWVLEAKMTEEDIYWGAKLACLEMIKTGTTFFNDMYWFWRGTARAVEEMGIRAAISAVFIDFFNQEKAAEQKALNEELFRESKRFSNRIRFTLGPHAIYTVSEESLRWAADFSRENDLLLHIHLSETKKEVDDCFQKNGVLPVEYLDKIGFLGPNVIACHSVWLSQAEIHKIKQHEVKVVHNPVSNMKLTVGGTFPYEQFRQAGVTTCLGTDGCSSNNNLDMLETVKFASLLQKHQRNDSTALPAKEAFEMATTQGAKAFGLNSGQIEVGSAADIALIDLKKPELTPHFDLHSDLAYAANGSCVDTVICDGKILMKERRVDGEEEILEGARRTAFDLVRRASQ